jgi:hypothetical protein
MQFSELWKSKYMQPVRLGFPVNFVTLNNILFLTGHCQSRMASPHADGM